ncbi:transcriptional regulator, TrmB (plasmid) [Haloterrigena turkmenica DSM 5511]|uniref:Transcriptional regulator, TrmB n=1 Tax=Haloterrigena turkmenica (strain ATCC 51198 / DSM 5511 / JCM 9101 / NCIMB 13204 / VKM B-1734 / 4k) TaxID=543526 RepID=D2S2R4_HALTV|nr:helix-turn-helix domain-containing protein [Haloterrigena turkmenica]ADB63661.1 transcriptional regulator, TrmB [Haloterrigena turkmenica DSM 5511]
MSSEVAAANALEELGLTEYEARCFVALTRISQGTAKDISQVADVPRSRVYDTVDRLHRRGLVDIQQSEPREFRAIAKEQAFEKLRQDYNASIDAADEALDQVESAKSQEKKGVWAIADAGHVADRVIDLIDNANDHIHFIIADEEMLEQSALDQLAAASERGVTILVEAPSDLVQDRFQQAVPDAHIVVQESLQESRKVVNKWPGQLVMADHQSILMSGVEENRLPGVNDETAMWSHGRDHGFAAWMPELLEDRVDESESSD